jgi:hypothetical protein
MLIRDFEGRDWNLDLEAVTVDEWRDLKRKYKMSPAAFEGGAAEADPDAMTFLYWVINGQNGNQSLSLGDHLKPDILKLHSAFADASKAEREAEREPEPEPGNPTQGPPPSPASPSLPAARPSPAAPEVTAPATA